MYQRPESRDEAERWLTQSLAGERIPSLILAIGFGDGYLLDVLEACGSQARVLALEPDAQSADRCRTRRDWSGWHSANRMRVLVGPHYEGADEAWRLFPSNVDDCTMLVHPHLLQGPATAEAVRVAQGIVAGARANAAARRKFAPRYLTNVLRNVPAIIDGYDVAALSDAYRGVPAIVAAAGPSLDAALPALAQHRERAVLFAVDTALRPCLSAGISPQFVVGADPSVANARHFQWLPECRHTWLIAESALDRTATDVFDGRTLFFRVSRHHPWPWLQSLGCDAGQIDMWGSVLTAAFGAAVLAGCDPIVIVGADLAFTDGQPYARGTTYEFDWACGEALGIPLDQWWKVQTGRGQTRTEPDLQRRDTLTTTSMVSFRDWLVARAQRSGRRVINATQGGILHGNGIEPGTIDLALDAWPAQTGLDPSSRLNPDRAGTRGLVTDPAGAGKRSERAALRGRAVEAIAAVRDLLGGGHAPHGQNPISDWKEFSGDGFDALAVGSALQQAGDELARRATVVPGCWRSTASHSPALDATLMHALPEGVRRWSSLQSSETSVSDVRVTALSRSDTDRERIAADALALLHWIKAHAAASGASDAELLAWASGDGAAWQALPEPLRWGVALFTASLGHAAAGSVPAIPAAFPRPDDVTVTLTQREESVALAIARRLRDWVNCVETLSTSVPLREMSLRFALLERHLRAPRQRDGQSGELTVTTSCGGREVSRLRLALDRAALPHLFMGAIGATSTVRLERRMAALTIAAGNADAGDGDSDSRMSAAILPEPIPQPGSPRSIVAYGVEGACVCLRFHSTESVRVAKDGSARAHHRWPHGIIGELPLGATGAVAWGNGRSIPDRITPGYVMYRHRAEDAPVVEALPFRPVLGSWCGDRIFWSCLPSGAAGWTGIASWAPGEAPRQELSAITTFDIHRQTDGSLVLEPCARGADDSIERRRATMAWRWQPGSAMQPFPLGAYGASSHRAESRGWIAIAYPHADAVRLMSANGTVLTMLCPSPFRLAWLDGDLMVSTLSLELWRFPRVIEQLERLTGGESGPLGR